MKRLGLLAVLGLGLLGSCATHRYAVEGYDFQPPEKIELNQDYLDIKAVLHQGLENIGTSGIFHLGLTERLRDVEFVIVKVDKSDFGGWYVPIGKPRIRVNLNEPHINAIKENYSSQEDKEVADMLIGNSISLENLKILTHEIMHYDWFNRLTLKERGEFRRGVLQGIRERDSFMKTHPGISEENIPAFYKNLGEFLSYKDYYQKSYGVFFNRAFYGTEAYAYLMTNIIIDNSFLRKDAESNGRGEAGFERMIRESAYSSSLNFDGLTPEMKEFYRGCIDDYYFQLYERGRYFDFDAEEARGAEIEGLTGMPIVD